MGVAYKELKVSLWDPKTIIQQLWEACDETKKVLPIKKVWLLYRGK